MQVNPYLFFNGNCDEALKYYQKVLGAQIEAMLPYGDGPADMPIPADWKTKIMHSRITIDGEVLMASDAHARRLPSAAGVFRSDHGRGSRRSRTPLHRARGRRHGANAVRQELLLQRVRHVRRQVRHSLDGQLPEGGHVKRRLVLPAPRIDRGEFAPAQQQQPRRQSAAAADPVAHRRRIGFLHRARGLRFGIDPAAAVDRPRGMKSQHRAARHADALAPASSSAPACRPTGMARRSPPARRIGAPDRTARETVRPVRRGSQECESRPARAGSPRTARRRHDYLDDRHSHPRLLRQTNCPLAQLR